MSYEVNRTNFFISTSQRQAGGTPSDFTIPLFKPLTLSKATNYFKIKFNTVSMPYSWKQLEEFPYISGCTFSWNGGAPVSFRLQFEAGNFNINDYLNELLVHLTPELATIAPTNDLVYDFSYNQPQGWVVLTITSPSNTPFNLKLGTTSPPAGVFDSTITPFIMCTVLGFPSNSTGVVFNGANPTNTSTNQINCAPISALFIRSINLRVIAYESLIEQSVPSDILCKIDVVTQPYTIINWWNNIDLETRVNTQVIDNLSFQLTAINSYNPINMHGQDWYLGLSILEYNDPVAEELVNRFNAGPSGGGVKEVEVSGTPLKQSNNPPPPLSGVKEVQQSQGDTTPDDAEIQAELENLKNALNELDTAEARDELDQLAPSDPLSGGAEENLVRYANRGPIGDGVPHMSEVKGPQEDENPTEVKGPQEDEEKLQNLKNALSELK